MSTLPQLLTRTELYKTKLDNWDLRQKHVKTHAWFLLTAETALELAYFLEGKSVIEVAAGNGYLAAHLRDLGVTNYKAYDFFRAGYYSRKDVNYGVMNRNAFRINIKAADVVMMTWPMYNEPFARKIATKMKSGQILIYQGEGSGGCTGCDRFHGMLEDKFEHLPEISSTLTASHIRWYGVHDDWHVYIKR